MLLEHSLIYHESTYDTAIKVVESESDIRITTVTLDLALMGELYGVSVVRICEKIFHVIMQGWVSDSLKLLKTYR